MKLRALRIALSLFFAVNIAEPFSHASSAKEQRESQAEHNTYSSKIALTYNYRFGEAHPFSPSNIETRDGAFIDAKDFPTAQYCGHCHQEAHAQWRRLTPTQTERPGI